MYVHTITHARGRLRLLEKQGVVLATQHSRHKSRLFKLQTRSPRVSLLLNLAGRQGCNSDRQRAGATRLQSRTAAIKRKREREREGGRWVTGVQETAHGSETWPKEVGSSLLLEKLTRERYSREGRERERWLSDFDLVTEGLMQLSSSSSIPFLSAWHTSTLSRAHQEPRREIKCGIRREQARSERGKGRKHGKFGFTALFGLLCDCVALGEVGGEVGRALSAATSFLQKVKAADSSSWVWSLHYFSLLCPLQFNKRRTYPRYECRAPESRGFGRKWRLWIFLLLTEKKWQETWFQRLFVEKGEISGGATQCRLRGRRRVGGVRPAYFPISVPATQVVSITLILWGTSCYK